MKIRSSAGVMLTGLLLGGVPAARGDEPARKDPVEAAGAAPGRKAVERGLEFLVADALKWRKEHQCATCHHGTMTVWALSEAGRQGYAVAAETLGDMTKWTRERIKDIDKPRDTRPGWKMVNTPALYLETMAQAVPGQKVISADERARIVAHLLRHQEADGSWAWSLAPAQNRPPPHFESDEVATLLAYLALGPHVPADGKTHSEVRAGRTSAAAWLAKAAPSDTNQAAVLRLLVRARAGESITSLQPAIDAFLGRQNRDGGWSQLKDLPSDAYATGQALYYLNLAGVKNDRPQINRGISFLLSTQRENGSWPMTPRANPGAKPASNSTPITYFGSAWATLGLMRTLSR